MRVAAFRCFHVKGEWSNDTAPPVQGLDGQETGCRVPQVRVRSLDANLGSSERPKNSVQHSNCPLKPTPGLSGPPSITLSALSRDTWTREGFDLLFVEGLPLPLLLPLLFAHATKARFQNPAVERVVPPTIYPVTVLPTMIRCSDSPTFFREARRPISPTMTYCFTRVAHGLPCMRTSCA
jgi:hypothetical protein